MAIDSLTWSGKMMSHKHYTSEIPAKKNFWKICGLLRPAFENKTTTRGYRYLFDINGKNGCTNLCQNDDNKKDEETFATCYWRKPTTIFCVNQARKK